MFLVIFVGVAFLSTGKASAKKQSWNFRVFVGAAVFLFITTIVDTASNPFRTKNECAAKLAGGMDVEVLQDSIIAMAGLICVYGAWSGFNNRENATGGGSTVDGIPGRYLATNLKPSAGPTGMSTLRLTSDDGKPNNTLQFV